MPGPCTCGSPSARHVLDGATRLPSNDSAFCATINTRDSLALAGGRALWAAGGGGNTEETTLSSASISQPHGGMLLYASYDSLSGGASFRGVAGSSSTLAYGFEHWVPKECPESPCPQKRVHSPVMLLRGDGSSVPVARSELGQALATHAGRVAVLLDDRVTVHSAASGAVLGWAAVPSKTCGLQLSEPTVAIVTASGVVVYDWRRHTRIGSVAAFPT